MMSGLQDLHVPPTLGALSLMTRGLYLGVDNRFDLVDMSFVSACLADDRVIANLVAQKPQ